MVAVGTGVWRGGQGAVTPTVVSRSELLLSADDHDVGYRPRAGYDPDSVLRCPSGPVREASFTIHELNGPEQVDQVTPSVNWSCAQWPGRVTVKELDSRLRGRGCNTGHSAVTLRQVVCATHVTLLPSSTRC